MDEIKRFTAPAGKSRALVLGGKKGLLGQTLARVLRHGGWQVLASGRGDFEVGDSLSMERFLDRAEPNVVFNTLAYTAVDQAEDEPQPAMDLNKSFPAALGRLSREYGFTLVHFSTDFVFDGKKTEPYTEADQPNPQSVYGKTKLAGENALREISPLGLTIIRTAWLFGPGKKNFVKTILDLAQNKTRLDVVHDQIGSPTYTEDAALYAHALACLAPQTGGGLYHAVNAGQASWCELASEAVQLAGLDTQVRSITTADYPTKAARPAFSVLDTQALQEATGLKPRSWIKALREYVFREYEPAGGDDT